MSRIWTGKIRRFLIPVLILYLTTMTSAQDFGFSKAKIGREIDVRCLYPAGTYGDYSVAFPIVLEYHNKSLVPQTFELSWSLGYRVPPEYEVVVLEPGAKKRLPFLFPSGVINQLYSLEVNDQNIPTGVTTNSQDRAAGLLTSNNDSLDYLRSLQLVTNPYYNPANNADGAEFNTPQSLSNLDEEVFPEHWAALQALQVLVCYDLTALNLGDLQYQALVNWVRQGGELVIISNGLPTEYRGTPLEDILPMNPESIVTEDDRIRVQGPLKRGTTTLMGSAGEELLVERTVSRGTVYYLTVPLLNSDILGKEKTQQLWRFVFDKQPTYSNGPHTLDLMRTMPELPRTEAAWVALFVILYGIIVGPVNLSILRKKDKMLWSFVTVPVVAILFAGSAYALNRFVRPSTPVLRELGYLSIQAEEKIGTVEAEQLLFSPHGQTFTVRSDKTTFFQTTGRSYGAFGNTIQGFGLYEQTPQGGLQAELEMGTWDIRRFAAEGNMELESAFLVSVTENTVEIDSPLASDQASATIYIPTKGASEAFTLERGKHTYDLTFTGHNPNSVFQWSRDKYPGRYDLVSRVHSAQASTATGKLYFCTEKLSTPIQMDQDSLYRHDYLVDVGFEL